MCYRDLAGTLVPPPPKKAETYTQNWDWPFLGSGGNTTRPCPALEVQAVEGVCHISSSDTVWLEWKSKPIDWNSPAVPVFPMQLKHRLSRGRAVQSPNGSSGMAHRAVCYCDVALGDSVFLPCTVQMGTTRARPGWKPFLKFQCLLIGVRPRFPKKCHFFGLPTALRPGSLLSF